jgi:hypothetical protein
MLPIDEREDEQTDKSNSSPSDFGEDFPEKSSSKSRNPPNTFLQVPDVPEKTQWKDSQTNTGLTLNYNDIGSHESI